MNPKRFAINLITRIARANNYHVIPDWEIPDYPLVRHLQDIFSAYKIDCVLDVGANYGQYRDLLRKRVGYKGLILSFEPVPHIARHLIEFSKSDPEWKVFDFALGSKVGRTKINVTKAPSRNSILAPRKDIVKDFWSSDAVIEVADIDIQTVDETLSRNGIDSSRCGVYLKMDTQGFDLEVVKGASESLKHIRALQMEASIRPIYHEMPDYRESIAFMNQAGFQIAGMYPVSNDDSLRMVEFDCVMVNDRYANS